MEMKVRIPIILACMFLPSLAVASPLVQMVMRGGLCVYGECHQTLTINDDQSYAYAEGKKQSAGKLEDAQFAALQEALKQLDAKAVMEKPFTEICPSAYDGRESEYTFYSAQGQQTLASCTYIIDAGAEPFKTLGTIWSGIPK